jgi:hypothetical protein
MCRYNAQLLPHTRTAAGVDIEIDPSDEDSPSRVPDS